MAQNTSSAVMQQRRAKLAGIKRELDYFPTPPFAVRLVCEALALELGDLSFLDVWEPCCGEGHMARGLVDYFRTVRLSDVARYELRADLAAILDLREHELIDFTLESGSERSDVIFANPPFNLALDFIEAGLRCARKAVVMIVRGAFEEGADRYDKIFSKLPPTFKFTFSERVVMLEGRLVQAGAIDPFAEKPGTKASTATSYAAFVWIAGRSSETLLRWLAPSRRRLERPGDYPDYSAELLERILPPSAGGLLA